MAINFFGNESLKISLLEIQIMKNLNRFDFRGRLETRNFFVDVIFFFQKYTQHVSFCDVTQQSHIKRGNFKYEI